MAENTIAPALANFDPAAVSALTPDQRESMAARLKGAGYSAADVDRVFGGGQQVPPSSSGTPDRVMQQAASNANDPRTDEERAYDLHLGPARPEEYHLDGVYVGRPADADGLAALDKDFRQMLSAMAVPNAFARGMVSTIIEAVGVYPNLSSDGARSIYAAEQKAIVTRLFSGKSYDDIVALARAAANKIPAETRQMLAEGGVFESAAVMVQLARQGERLAAREAMKAKRKK